MSKQCKLLLPPLVGKDGVLYKKRGVVVELTDNDAEALALLKVVRVLPDDVDPDSVDVDDPEPPATPEQPVTAGKVNVNTADLAQLVALPKIGPKTAERIIAARKEEEFVTLDEVQEAGEISEANWVEVAPLIEV
ncbi:MAG: helix-hairpin-helix domain-containing protein [Cyanobacteria bacterium P01_H01_bin.121]